MVTLPAKSQGRYALSMTMFSLLQLGLLDVAQGVARVALIAHSTTTFRRSFSLLCSTAWTLTLLGQLSLDYWLSVTSLLCSALLCSLLSRSLFCSCLLSGSSSARFWTPLLQKSCRCSAWVSAMLWTDSLPTDFLQGSGCK